MSALFISVLVASFLGSLHCIGMCGGFVTFYAGSSPQTPRFFLSHLAYNGGRLLTYVLLGFLWGSAGAALDLAGSAVGFQSVATYAAGTLMVAWGLVMLLQQSGRQVFLFAIPKPWQAWLNRRYKALKSKPPLWRATALGLFSTFLPCGWLYAFAVTASATASPWRGMVVMFAFWLGTVPAMLGAGIGIHQLSMRLRNWIPRLSAAAILLIGVLTFWQRASLSPHQMHKMHQHHTPATQGANHKPTQGANHKPTQGANHKPTHRMHHKHNAKKAKKAKKRTPVVPTKPPCHHHQSKP